MAPPTHSTHALTRLLAASVNGDSEARKRLWQLVYDELHSMARAQMACERAGRTLQPTALLHEAYLKLMAGGDGHFENRRHFFAAAANAMQQIRVDDARRRRRIKRGGGTEPDRLNADSMEPAQFEQDGAEVLALDESLARLQDEHPDLAEVVRLRYFAGLSAEETADVIGVSVRTVANRWRMARAWLYDRLGGE
ncbi:MAG: sigma-70 family RNA polymerase sigma factor [Planctomycetes bacterium]|nr:sigma-70 family RNA polymerase sigma factor [Planctomycetota bacterium]